jgi:hypothetical protein
MNGYPGSRGAQKAYNSQRFRNHKSKASEPI